jgi:hypothetical protein
VRESKIEREVCAYARDNYDMLTRKLSSELTTGWPDRMLLTPEGYICFIEFKQLEKPLKPVQERMCIKLMRYGFDVYVVDDLEKGKRLVDYISDAKLIQDIVHGQGEPEAAELILPARLSDPGHPSHREPQTGHAVARHGPGQDRGDSLRNR